MRLDLPARQPPLLNPMASANIPVRWSTCASSLLVALAVAACDSKGSGRDKPAPIQPGDPYTGWLEVEVRPASSGGRPWKRYGQGSAQLLDSGDGKARLIVFGAIDDDEGDAGFTLDGEFTAEGWRSAPGKGPVSLEIGRDGRVIGGGTLHPQEFTFSGLLTPTSFTLDVELELLESDSAELPAGSVFNFSYGLSRAMPRAVGDSPDATDQDRTRRKCRRIRYEVRPVANIGEGSISMVRVPVCLK